ncbi:MULTISPECIES: WXG100 family type VII secretion target [unclassified Crossiella]|uniref:WXG100 family type VII secretion target n=1 Tax=unclassified Crossiella TaxID=2620835 RepID=UPI001FFFD1FC|nr:MULTISPECIES: WXG100 family type VII secretion target [unclassified Crossiella]MCK2239948.1 WXG100 family type VII secretion target [Crossiella sp. S99.2]MCK2252656.1 WXG100 family type VII secretion target [Crossiella sp. S99.1]
MSTPQFQKTDTGMKGGYQAIQSCLDTCRSIGGNVANISTDLGGNWQGQASQTFLANLRAWMEDYNRIINSLDEIGELVGISDQQMNDVEADITLLSQGAFTGGEGDRVFKSLIS